MPEDAPPDVWGKIFDGLKEHPEATLAVALVFAGMSLYVAGAGPWVALGLPVAIYVLYFGRMTYRERHVERMADKEVERLEKTVGLEIRQKAQRALARRRQKDGPAG